MNLQKETARRNEIWNAASPAEKRVLLAKDVITQIKNKKLKATPGCWLLMDTSFAENESVQEKILEGEICECCALGGLMAAKIAFCNQVKGKDNDASNSFCLDRDNKKFKLGDVFHSSQLRKIELAFEGGEGAEQFHRDRNYDVIPSQRKYEDFYCKYDGPEERMLAIMENIVENGGEFKIGD